MLSTSAIPFMNEKFQNLQTFWYAARTIGCGQLVRKRLERDGVRYYYVPVAGRILFIRCTSQYISELLTVFWGSLFFYMDSKRRFPAVIRDRDMDNFILVTSQPNELIYLGEVTPEFLVGERVRVIAGVFKGAEGVVRRIKGDRRLIVSIDGVTAVATCHISPEFLEIV